MTVTERAVSPSRADGSKQQLQQDSARDSGRTSKPFPEELRSNGAGQEGERKEGAACVHHCPAPGGPWDGLVRPGGLKAGGHPHPGGLGQVRISLRRLAETGARTVVAWP